MLGSVDGMLQLDLERDAVDVYFRDVAFYFLNLHFVVDTLYFILIFVHLSYLLFDDLLFTIWQWFPRYFSSGPVGMRGALGMVGSTGSWKCVICAYSSSQPVSRCLMVMTPDSTSCTSSSYCFRAMPMTAM